MSRDSAGSQAQQIPKAKPRLPWNQLSPSLSWISAKLGFCPHTCSHQNNPFLCSTLLVPSIHPKPSLWPVPSSHFNPWLSSTKNPLLCCSPMISLPLHSLPPHSELWEPILRHFKTAGLPTRRPEPTAASQGRVFPINSLADVLTTVHSKGIPPSSLHSFQKVWWDHSTAVGTRKAALMTAFKDVVST